MVPRQFNLLEEPVMTFASILVHVEVDPAEEPRLRLAADLANQFDAALVGVGAEIYEPPTAAAALGYVDGETLVAEAKAIQDDLRQTEALFAKAATTVRMGSDWRSGIGLPAEMVIQESRAADLIVCGPRKPDKWGFHDHADVGEILMGAGRPVLVTPPGFSSLDASTVVVAWKETREARRAISDALPFLKRADQVLVAEVCEQNDEDDARAHVADVVEFLGRHGVKASATVRCAGRGSTASALMQIADMQDAGLIVAGGYGHARVQEWIFGGVTQALLAGFPRAVLLSH